MTDADASLVVSWRRKPHVAEMGLQQRASPLTEAEHLSWFKASRGGRVDYMIVRQSDSAPIGSVSFVARALDRFGRCGELGKYIGEETAAGMGYAYEASSCWLEFGFSRLGLDCVIARTRRDNAANIRVNEKLGMRIEPWPPDFPGRDDFVFMRMPRPDPSNPAATRTAEVPGENTR